MQNPSAIYPATPENVDPQILNPSREFKSEASKVLGAILLFVVTYILLFIAALGLAALSAVGGVALIMLKPMLVTIMVGIGLAGLGLMVVIFLIKFLFKSHKVDRRGMIEITAAEHPHLFDFIRKLSHETRTSLPKRIYLSPDVNASVFYDSSFWSMFLPVRKNLLIGLGLVNVVNLSEFKAVIAHEFGHFSQRSMKLGSYIYNMNHVIYNMLYDNEGYSEAVEAWGNASGYFAIFANLTIAIVKGIQWILQQVYAIMNTIYMSLSRQMEFHADTVAASVSGGNHLMSALRRLEVAETSYNNVLQFYNENFEKCLKPENIYSQHRDTMRLFGEFHQLRVEHGLLQVDAASFARFNKSRVSIKDQWASHPSTDDRENHLRSLNIETTPRHEAAWVLFNNPNQLQEQMTLHVFANVKYEKEIHLMNTAAYADQYRETLQRYQLPAVYKGFYDDRSIAKTDLRGIETRIVTHAESLDQVLTEDVLSLPHQIAGIKADLQVLQAIINRQLRIKNFEFDGRKMKSAEASPLHTQLTRALEEAERILAESDDRMIAWFLRKAQSTGKQESLRQKYSELFEASDVFQRDQTCVNKMGDTLMQLHNRMPLDQIRNVIAELKLNEVDFRNRLEQLLTDPKSATLISEDQRKLAAEYLSKDWVYFVSTNYIEDALERLNRCMFMFYKVSAEKLFKHKADLLTTQLTLAGISEGVNV